MKLSILKRVFILLVVFILFSCGGGGGALGTSNNKTDSDDAPIPIPIPIPIQHLPSITSFTLQDQVTGADYLGTISQAESVFTIKILTPSTIANDALFKVFFTTDGAKSVLVDKKPQQNGLVRSFILGQVVLYTVVATDGSKRDYQIVRTTATLSNNSFTSFYLVDKLSGESYAGIIIPASATGTATINLTTSVRVKEESLIAVFTTDGASSVTINRVIQQSGVTANKFIPNNPMIYSVEAEDGSIQNYVVLTNLPRLNVMSPPIIASGGEYPNAVVLAPHGKYAYVTNSRTRNISMYGIDSNNGQLFPLTPFLVDTGSDVHSPIITPNGKYLYALDYNHNSIVSYAINNQTGQLVPTTESSIKVSLPNGIAITPDSRYLYVGSNNSGKVVTYRIDDDSGNLTWLADSFATGGSIYSIVIDHTGSHAYVISSGTSDGTFFYTFNISKSGTLVVDPEATLNDFYFPITSTMTHDGKFIYVAGFGGRLLILQRQPSGTFTKLFELNLPAGYTTGMIITADDKYLIMTNGISDMVEMYSIARDGGLTLEYSVVSGTSAGNGQLAINPNGENVYVPNSGSSNNNSDNTVSMYEIN